MTRQSFIKGTMILLAAGIINRLLGFIPRITLPRIIGAEGVGLYQLAYPFLTVILTIITGGIPLAIAKLVAAAESEGDGRRVKRILTVSLSFVIGISLLFTVLCVVMAPWITQNILTDQRVYYSFLSMSPMIVLIGVSSVLRGYFQGKLDMIPTALSQVVETLVRIVAVLLLAYLMLPYGLEYAAAGAMLGVGAGELCGLIVLLWKFFQDKKRTSNNGETVYGKNEAEAAAKRLFEPLRELRRIFAVAIPVTAGRMVGSLSYLLESIMIAQSLAMAGIATAVATAQYGALQGMIFPIVLLPGALTNSLAVSLIPSLAEASARQDYRTIHKRLHQALRLALVAGAPFAVLMYVLAEPICMALYHNASIAPMLKMMAPIALFIYLQAPLQASLQALDQPGKALLNTFIGAAVKLFLIVQLATDPELGIYGALIAIIVNIVLVTGLHGFSVVKLLRFRMQIADFVKVFAAMIVMAAIVHFVFYRVDLMANVWLKLMAACSAGVVVYLLIMVWVKLIDRYDIVRIPILGKLFKW